MPLQLMLEYWEAITVIEAQETLLDVKVASYAHLKKQDRDKFHKELRQAAFPKLNDSPEESITIESIVKRLTGRGLSNGSRI